MKMVSAVGLRAVKLLYGTREVSRNWDVLIYIRPQIKKKGQIEFQCFVYAKSTSEDFTFFQTPSRGHTNCFQNQIFCL